MRIRVINNIVISVLSYDNILTIAFLVRFLACITSNKHSDIAYIANIVDKLSILHDYFAVNNILFFHY